MFTTFRFAARSLARWRGGLVVATVALALGIGTFTSLYVVVRVLDADLDGVPEPHRLGRVYASSAALGIDRAPVALNEFDASLASGATFQSIGAYAEAEVTIRTGDTDRRLAGGYATPGFFAAVGVPPAEGRVFTAADLAGKPPVAMVSTRFWRERFGGAAMESATVSVNGIERRVIGVMPAQFSYPFIGITADVWVPLGPASMDAPLIVSVFGRLRPGGGWPAARAELQSTRAPTLQWQWRVIPVTDDARLQSARAWASAFGPAIVVLLLACANVSSLLLVRGLARQQEFTIRLALGASRRRLAGELIREHLLLALAGGALGCGTTVLLVRNVSRALVSLQPALAARLSSAWPVFGIALAASGAASLIFGGFPALRLSRRDVPASLHSRRAAPRADISGYAARDVVVFVEVATATGLLVFAAMLLNLFNAMHLVKPAFPADRVIAMRVTTSETDSVVSRLAGIPGVISATAASGMLGGRGGTSAVQADSETGYTATMSRVPVGDRFLETLGIAVRHGRPFTAGEARGHAALAVLSESAAAALFPAGDAIGKRVRLTGHIAETATVIGICADAVHYGTLARAGLIPPDVYVPFDVTSVASVVLARVSADPHGFLHAIAAAAPVPVGRLRPEAVVLADEAAFSEPGASLIVVRLLGVLALAALMLAATGVSAGIGHTVAQRQREFAVRLALGGTSGGVLRLVLAREAKLIALALVIGASFTAALTRALFPELAILSATAPFVWISAVGAGGGIAALASVVAGWRVARLTLLDALNAN